MIVFDSRKVFLRSAFFKADFLIVAVVGAIIYGLMLFAAEWRESYNPTGSIDLSMRELPRYALFSAFRGGLALLLSFAVSFVVGLSAAKSQRAEKIILPVLDIMQSIPVLGFLPGLVLGLVALFPNSNIGIELACILMIFTGQVWNLAFAFYSSLKSVPIDLKEAAAIMGFSPLQRLKILELPYSATNIAWNGVMSMAGGWFFLTICESFTLGQRTYRLPGIGAYMALALEVGDGWAIVAGLATMAFIIFGYDVFLWRPILEWAYHFRLEERPEENLHSKSLIGWNLVRGSWILKFLSSFSSFSIFVKDLQLRRIQRVRDKGKVLLIPVGFGLRILVSLGILLAVFRLGEMVRVLTLADWFQVFQCAAITCLRVISAVILGTLWAVPFGVWIVSSRERLSRLQPVIQMCASYPAPMLYPLVLTVFIYCGLSFDIIAVLLMVLGVQWYILFNVIAGAMRIPTEMGLALDLMSCSRWNRWRHLFLPSLLPSLVTGWISAAGGAWNASIVSEVIFFRNQRYEAQGLGSALSGAAEQGDFSRLAACLLVMVVLVVGLNRIFWSRLYKIVHTRFILD